MFLYLQAFKVLEYGGKKHLNIQKKICYLVQMLIDTDKKS